MFKEGLGYPQAASVISNSKTIESGTVIYGVDLAVINGESAEVIPGFHSVAALIQQLAGFGI